MRLDRKSPMFHLRYSLSHVHCITQLSFQRYCLVIASRLTLCYFISCYFKCYCIFCQLLLRRNRLVSLSIISYRLSQTQILELLFWPNLMLMVKLWQYNTTPEKTVLLKKIQKELHHTLPPLTNPTQTSPVTNHHQIKP